MTFPASIASKQDSKFFSETQIDETVRGELEGGYAHTRPRTTRAPRMKFTTGFTSLSTADKDTLAVFFALKGTHTSFVYTHPVSAITYACRFLAVPNYKYTGVGVLNRWDVGDITLEEV
jgi:hypothetical protein